MSAPDCTPFCDPSCAGDHHPILKALIRCPEKELTADHSTELKEFETCFDHCVQSGGAGGWQKNMEIPEADERFRFPTLHWAAVLGRLSAVRVLVMDRGVDVTLQTSEGHTALHRVCLRMFEAFQHRGIAHRARTKVKRLVELLKSSLAVKDGRNLTPLLLACTCYMGSQGVVMNEFYSTLISSIGQVAKGLSSATKDVAVNSKNNDGDTALHLLATSDILSPCITTLLSAGANPLTRNRNNQTAYDIARDSGASRNAKQLLVACNAHGPNETAPDRRKSQMRSTSAIVVDEESNGTTVDRSSSSSTTPRIPKLVINAKQGVIVTTTSRQHNHHESESSLVSTSSSSSSSGKNQSTLPPPLVPCSSTSLSSVSTTFSSRMKVSEMPPPPPPTKLLSIDSMLNEKAKQGVLGGNRKVNGSSDTKSKEIEASEDKSSERDAPFSSKLVKNAMPIGSNFKESSERFGPPQHYPPRGAGGSTSSPRSSSVDQASVFSHSRKRRDSSMSEKATVDLNASSPKLNRHLPVGNDSRKPLISAAINASKSKYGILETSEETESSGQSHLRSLQNYVETAAAVMDKSIIGQIQMEGQRALPSPYIGKRQGTSRLSSAQGNETPNPKRVKGESARGHSSEQVDEETITDDEPSVTSIWNDCPEADAFIRKLQELKIRGESVDVLTLLSNQEMNRYRERMKKSQRLYESALNDVEGLELKRGIKVSLVHHLTQQLDVASEKIKRYSEHYHECLYKVPRLHEKRKKLQDEYEVQGKVARAHKRLQVNLPIMFSALGQRQEQLQHVPDELVARVDKASVTNQYQMMNDLLPSAVSRGEAGGSPLRQSQSQS